MRNVAILSLVLSTACGQSKAPVGPQSHDDAGQSADCESQRRKSTALYQQAATAEGLAANLHAEFVEANVHMVMSDCSASPQSVLPCLAKAESAAYLESHCLIPLDEAGEVEGRRFNSE